MASAWDEKDPWPSRVDGKSLSVAAQQLNSVTRYAKSRNPPTEWCGATPLAACLLSDGQVGRVMDLVAESLATMGMVQALLATIFLASYVLALGKFVAARSRLIAGAAAVASAAAFAACSRPWEAGLVLIAFVPLGMALLAGAAWALWHLATWRVRAASLEASPLRESPLQAAARPRLARVRAIHSPLEARSPARPQG